MVNINNRRTYTGGKRTMIGAMFNAFIIIIAILIGPINLLAGIAIGIIGIKKKEFSDIPQSIIRIIIGIVVTKVIIKILLGA